MEREVYENSLEIPGRTQHYVHRETVPGPTGYTALRVPGGNDRNYKKQAALWIYKVSVCGLYKLFMLMLIPGAVRIRQAVLNHPRVS